MSYGSSKKQGPRGNVVRMHPHPWRGQEYFHAKYESGVWLWYRWKDGVQVFGLDGADLPLWRHEKLASADASTPVLLCEGEKDVETVERLGLLACSCPSGALIKGKK